MQTLTLLDLPAATNATGIVAFALSQGLANARTLRLVDFYLKLPDGVNPIPAIIRLKFNPQGFSPIDIQTGSDFIVFPEVDATNNILRQQWPSEGVVFKHQSNSNTRIEREARMEILNEAGAGIPYRAVGLRFAVDYVGDPTIARHVQWSGVNAPKNALQFGNFS